MNNPTKRMLTAVIALLLSLATAYAQDGLMTESAWRTAYQRAQADRSSAKTLKSTGIGMLAGGAVIAIVGIRGSENVVCNVNGLSCTDPSLTNSVLRTGGVTSYSTTLERQRSWGLIAAGAGVSGFGAVLFGKGKAKVNAADERIQQLDSSGRDKGWKISVGLRGAGPTAQIAFHW